MIASMMALSLYDEPADNNGILVESENINWWDIWDEE